MGGGYLVASRDQPRVRRAADVTTAVVGVAFTLWGIVVFGISNPIQDALAAFAAALPRWALGALAFGYTTGLLCTAAVLILLLAAREWAAVRDAVLAGVLGSVVALVLMALYDHLWPVFFAELVQGAVPSQFPVVRVTVISAVLVAATPYLARPLRRLGWAIVLVVSAAAVAMALSVPSGVVAALGIGLAAGGLVLLVFGSPKGYPDVTEVAKALRQVGLDVAALRIARDQSWGVRRMIGTCAGVEIEVKAYGRDATDSQVMAKMWHSLLYRGASRRMTFSRIHSVEHEALVMLLAGDSGVTVPALKAAAAASEEVAVLVTTREGVALGDLDPPMLDHEALTALWRQVALMHNAGVTHGDLGGSAVRRGAEGFVVCDWSAGSLASSATDRALDAVNLLFATAVLVGPREAVGAAAEGLGHEPLAAAMGYLQPPALTRRARRARRASAPAPSPVPEHVAGSPAQPAAPTAPRVLAQLRDEVARVTQTSIPEPIRLRRLGPRQILTIALGLLLLSALVPLLTGIDYSQIWASLQHAQWWLVVASLVVGQLAFVPQGTAMMCAVGKPIPLRPMTILQPAVAFISFAVPGMAGRVAMESAFLYKYGVAPAVSVVKGAVDAFSGFLVQLAILAVAVVTGTLTLVPAAGGSGGSGGSHSVSWAVVALAVAVVVLIVLVVWRVPKIRGRVGPVVAGAWQALIEVLRSPRLALGLVLSQLAVQMLWGPALWTALLALGTHVSLVAATAVVVGTSLLQGIIPVPGGIGVSEAVLSALLVPLGVPAAVAMGAAVVWRVATFYLPAVEGFFASRSLHRNGYL